MTPHEYANAHQDRFLSELIELLRIPSVSSTPAHAPDMQRAATWLHDHLSALGFEAQVYQTPGHPIVYGEWLRASPDAPTLLVYGHYDVQPPDPLDQWHTPPFEPTVRDGDLYARGASDDKGQCFAHLKAAESILRAGGRLPVNLKFIIEGEEEKGSVHIKPFVRAHQDLLAADVVLVSDTANKGLDQPSIIYGLRGICYMELEVRGPRTDLHSGSYGGMVHNPAQALCEIIAQLHDANGTITIPGFYDNVRPLSDDERAAMARTPYTEEDLRRATGVPVSWGEADYALHERTGARPTLEVNGLLSGWTGEGAKTVLPARALAKISCRLAPDQDPADILRLVRDHVVRLTPPTVTSEVRLLHDGHPVITDIHAPAMQTAIAAYEEGWGARPVFVREGGSISVVVEFQRALGAPVVLMGFGLPDDGLHAPNEKFALECFRRGVATAISFYQKFGG